MIDALAPGRSTPARTYRPAPSLPCQSTRSDVVPVRSLENVPSCVPDGAASIEAHAEDVRCRVSTLKRRMPVGVGAPPLPSSSTAWSVIAGRAPASPLLKLSESCGR